MRNTLPIQPGILAPIPAHARYLMCQSLPEVDARAVLKALAQATDGERTVVGIGDSLISKLGASVAGLKPFMGIVNAKVKLPATPTDVMIWLRGDDRGELLARSRQLETLLATAFRIESVTDAFNHDGGRDLTGYEDGTENPKGEDAIDAAFIPAGAAAPVGSSFLAIQRWHHQFARFEAMPKPQQDHTYGRERESNEELDDAPESAHVKRTAQESFQPEAFLLRRSMPWAEGNQGGLVFAAFGRSFDAFEAQLRRMSGAEDGVIDALYGFTEPETGAYFWCPPVADGLIDLRAVGL